MLWGSLDVWKPRLVFWTGALAIGIVSVAFAWLADWTQKIFAAGLALGHWTYLLPLALTPAGFALSAWLAMRFFPNSGGSGIPQAIAARHLRNDEERSRLLSLRVAFGKIALTSTILLVFEHGCSEDRVLAPSGGRLFVSRGSRRR